MKLLCAKEILGVVIKTLITAGVGLMADGLTELGMRLVRKNVGVKNNDELTDFIIEKFEMNDEEKSVEQKEETSEKEVEES